MALLAVPSWSPAQAEGPGAAPVRAEADQPVFTGRFVSPSAIDADGFRPIYRYQVALVEVFGDVPITARRVTVRSVQALESCPVPQGPSAPASPRQPSPTTTAPSPSSTPTSDTAPDRPVDRRLRAFEAVLVDDEYVVTCADVAVVEGDAAALEALVAQYGVGRPPGGEEEPAPAFDEVSYLCPSTEEAVDVEDSSTCSTLEDDQSFDRAAAPGLALVIVGVLGWLLARRMGRGSR